MARGVVGAVSFSKKVAKGCLVSSKAPKLTREQLIEEARKETLAIQRLMIWQRLGYSAVALGFLLGWWGFYGSGPFAVGVIGVILLILGIGVSVILYTGIAHGRKNVRALMEAAGVDMDVDTSKAAVEERRAEARAAKEAGKTVQEETPAQQSLEDEEVQ